MSQLTETKKLLMKILETPYNQELQVPIKLGHGEIVVQRCRVELSRVRKRLQSRGLKVPGFKLKARIERRVVKENAVKSCDVVTFRKIRDDEIVIDLSEVDKVLHDIVQQEIKDEETKEKEQEGKIVIRRKVT